MVEQRTIQTPPAYMAIGRVIESISGARWYNVRLGADVAMQCADISSSGVQSPLGPSKIGVYPVGSYVIVYVPTSGTRNITDEMMTYTPTPLGYIVGSMPTTLGDNTFRVCDWVAPFTGADAVSDMVHHYPAMTFPTQYRDFNMGNPLDAIPGSDEGMMNEMGVGYGISRFFSWLRASDTAGVWCMYLDNLTRIAAYNYEFWTSGGERWIKNDEGEVNDVELFTPYPWEAMGMLVPDAAPADLIEGGGIYKPKQSSLMYEPKFEDQTGIPRHMKIRGYLGDLERDLVVLPKFDISGDEEDFVERHQNSSKYSGVLDLHKHMDGMYTVRSARGIISEKYIHIPVPKQLAVPEEKDGLGDGATNYRPAGYWGNEAISTDIHDKQS